MTCCVARLTRTWPTSAMLADRAWLRAMLTTLPRSSSLWKVVHEQYVPLTEAHAMHAFARYIHAWRARGPGWQEYERLAAEKAKIEDNARPCAHRVTPGRGSLRRCASRGLQTVGKSSGRAPSSVGQQRRAHRHRGGACAGALARTHANGVRATRLLSAFGALAGAPSLLARARTWVERSKCVCVCV